MWVFGYGSLIWKTGFPFEKKNVGYIDGYVRRFYQHSTDHRGTLEKPGRVVTLIPSFDGRVYGIAYKVGSEDEEVVLKYLDEREKGGYQRMNVLFHPLYETSMESFDILIYVADENNTNYAGPASNEDIAKQIFNSLGKSGTNAEYVFKLANAMREVAPNVIDEHLFGIEMKILELCTKDKLEDDVKLDLL